MNWISIHDKLPANNTRVFMLSDHEEGVIPCLEDDYSVGIYYKKKFYLGYHDVDYPFELNCVTHWMPLPEPPNEHNT